VRLRVMHSAKVVMPGLVQGIHVFAM